MANFGYTYGKGKFATANIDWVNDTIKARMVMNLTTADTEKNAEFVADLTTPDFFDGANNVIKTLQTNAVNIDEANLRAEMDADDETWTALGAGTSALTGIIIYKFVTNDADSPLIAYFDDDLPIVPGGGDVKIAWNIEGIVQIT